MTFDIGEILENLWSVSVLGDVLVPDCNVLRESRISRRCHKCPLYDVGLFAM